GEARAERCPRRHRQFVARTQMAAQRTRMNSTPTPPQWAEAALRLVLRPHDFGSVSGDLLEEYRDSVLPTRGKRRADWWYVRQVLGFLSRRAWVWGALSGAAMVARDAFDWFMPPADFLLRSRITTAVAVGLL